MGGKTPELDTIYQTPGHAKAQHPLDMLLLHLGCDHFSASVNIADIEDWQKRDEQPRIYRVYRVGSVTHSSKKQSCWRPRCLGCCCSFAQRFLIERPPSKDLVFFELEACPSAHERPLDRVWH